jgi:hypothetical protein
LDFAVCLGTFLCHRSNAFSLLLQQWLKWKPPVTALLWKKDPSLVTFVKWAYGSDRYAIHSKIKCGSRIYVWSAWKGCEGQNQYVPSRPAVDSCCTSPCKQGRPAARAPTLPLRSCLCHMHTESGRVRQGSELRRCRYREPWFVATVMIAHHAKPIRMIPTTVANAIAIRLI